MCGDKKQQEGESPSLPPLVAVPSCTPCDPPAALTEGNALSEPWPCIREPSCGIQDARPSPVMCPLCPVSPGFMQAVRKPLYGRGRWAQGSLRAQTVLPFLALPGSRPPLPPSPLLEASGSGWSQAGDSRWGSSARAAEDTCLPRPPQSPWTSPPWPQVPQEKATPCPARDPPPTAPTSPARASAKKK